MVCLSSVNCAQHEFWASQCWFFGQNSWLQILNFPSFRRPVASSLQPPPFHLSCAVSFWVPWKGEGGGRSSWKEPTSKLWAAKSPDVTRIGKFQYIHSFNMQARRVKLSGLQRGTFHRMIVQKVDTYVMLSPTLMWFRALDILAKSTNLQHVLYPNLYDSNYMTWSMLSLLH